MLCPFRELYWIWARRAGEATHTDIESRQLQSEADWTWSVYQTLTRELVEWGEDSSNTWTSPADVQTLSAGDCSVELTHTAGAIVTICTVLATLLAQVQQCLYHTGRTTLCYWTVVCDIVSPQGTVQSETLLTLQALWWGNQFVCILHELCWSLWYRSSQPHSEAVVILYHVSVCGFPCSAGSFLCAGFSTNSRNGHSMAFSSIHARWVTNLYTTLLVCVLDVGVTV